jgi:homoaconitate hydratase
MGSTKAQAYLASPEVVAASALSGKISSPGNYQLPEGWDGVEFGSGNGSKEEDHITNIDEALENIIGQLDDKIAAGERDYGENKDSKVEDDKPVEIFPGFPESISGEILFCDADDLNTDLIYRGGRFSKSILRNILAKSS